MQPKRIRVMCFPIRVQKKNLAAENIGIVNQSGREQKPLTANKQHNERGSDSALLLCGTMLPAFRTMNMSPTWVCVNLRPATDERGGGAGSRYTTLQTGLKGQIWRRGGGPYNVEGVGRGEGKFTMYRRGGGGGTGT